MQEELELEALTALVAHSNDGLQALLAQGDAVDKTEVQRPCLARILAEPRLREAKVELDRIRVCLGVALAQKFPTRSTCEAVLRER